MCSCSTWRICFMICVIAQLDKSISWWEWQVDLLFWIWNFTWLAASGLFSCIFSAIFFMGSLAFRFTNISPIVFFLWKHETNAAKGVGCGAILYLFSGKVMWSPHSFSIDLILFLKKGQRFPLANKEDKFRTLKLISYLSNNNLQPLLIQFCKIKTISHF